MNAFNTAAASTEETWNLLKTALLHSTNETCGKTKKCHYKRVTWWWNDGVNLAIVEKDIVGKRGSREAAKNNTHTLNEMQNRQFTQQRRLLK